MMISVGISIFVLYFTFYLNVQYFFLFLSQTIWKAFGFILLYHIPSYYFTLTLKKHFAIVL